MVRRSKIKVRPTISRPKSTATENESVTKPMQDVSENQVLATQSNTHEDVKKPERQKISESNPSVSILCSAAQDDGGSKNDEKLTEKINSAGVTAGGREDAATHLEDNGKNSPCMKVPAVRRRKLVACPAMAKKRQKLNISDSRTSKSFETDQKTELAVVKAEETVILQNDCPKSNFIHAEGGMTAILAVPVSPQQVTNGTPDKEPSIEYTTLTTVATVATVSTKIGSMMQDDSVDFKDGDDVNVTMGLGNFSIKTSDVADSNCSNEEHFYDAEDASQRVVADKESSTAGCTTITEFKASGKNGASSRTSNRLISNRRKSAMEKLKTLKKGQENTTEWPGFDENLVSMSDLIFLNPPETVGLRLGMHSQQSESVRSTVVQKSEQEQISHCDASPAADAEENSVLPVPQIRIAADGSVIIDEESLVLDTQKPVATQVGPAVYEFGKDGIVNQRSFLRRPFPQTARWTRQETDKFYRCLCIVGAEFSLMSAMFRGKTSDVLRRKFRRERKTNPKRVDNALMQQHLSKWTDDMFETSDTNEDNVLKSPKLLEETVK